jgi:DNA-binding LacI/PurR family transcriptional regulator
MLRPYEQLAGKPRLAMLSGLLRSAEPPTVLLCANGYVLARTADDLAALGVDVELACMDDSGPARLSSVEAVLPSEEMARQAMNLLGRRIASPRPYAAAPRHVIVPVAVRESAGVAAY